MNIICRYKGDGALNDCSSWHHPGLPLHLETWQFDLKQEVFVEEHPVITGARRGDLIRVMRYVGQSERFEVRDFQMTLLHKSPICEKGGLEVGGAEADVMADVMACNL